MSQQTPLESAVTSGPTGFSRRQVMAWMVALAATSALPLVGCGGASIFAPGTTLKTLSAAIELPSGVAATDLLASCSGGANAIGGAQFGTEVLSDVPSLVMALNKTDFKMCQMALVDPDGGSPTLNARSSAIALIYFGVGGAMLSDADRGKFLQDISASSGVDDLAAAIALAQASDPYALSNGGPVLKAKVQQVIRGFVARPSKTTATAEHRDGLPAHLLIEPAAEVEGMTVVQGSTDLQYLVQNVRRRPGTLMTYVVGHEAANGATTSESSAQVVGNPLYIPSTKNILSLPYGWSQVSSAPASVALLNDDVKTKYEAVVINTTFSGSTPSFYSDPKYASHVQGWRDEAAKLRKTGILQGLANLVLEVMGLGGTIFTTSSLAALLPGITSTTALEAAMVSAAAGNVYYEYILQSLLQNFTAESIFALEIPVIQPLVAQVSAARAAELVAAQSSAAAVQLIRAGLLVLIVLGVVEVADVIAVALDTHGGSEANLWSLTAFQPQVTLNPAHASYSPGSSLTISVSAPGIGSQGVTYRWNLSGSSLANISDGTHVGSSFTGTNSTVTLATTPSTQGDLTLSVTALKNGVEVGTATATYTLASGPPIQYVSFLRPNFHDGLGIYYMEFMLATDRTRVRLTAVNNGPGYNGATSSMTVSLPPITSPVYPVTQEIVADQNMNLAQMMNQGYITNIINGSDSWTAGSAFRLVNYGDRVLLYLALAGWVPGTSTEAEAKQRAEAYLANLQYTVQFL